MIRHNASWGYAIQKRKPAPSYRLILLACLIAIAVLATEGWW